MTTDLHLGDRVRVVFEGAVIEHGDRILIKTEFGSIWMVPRGVYIEKVPND